MGINLLKMFRCIFFGALYYLVHTHMNKKIKIKISLHLSVVLVAFLLQKCYVIEIFDFQPSRNGASGRRTERDNAKWRRTEPSMPLKLDITSF